MVHRGSATQQVDDGTVPGTGPTWRDALRGPTREAHAALDHALTGPSGRVSDVAGYVRVVTTLHALHAWSESRLRTWAAWSPVARGLPADVMLPDRASLYAGDLAALGQDPEDDSAEAPDPACRGADVDEAEGIALLYLLGGSSAGARVLLRGLPDEVPRAARRGLSDASGPESARLWKAIRGLLSEPADTEVAARAAAEADALFTWLRSRAEERAA